MINMLRKGIKFSMQRIYFPQSHLKFRHSKRFKCIKKFKSLTFQLRAICFHTFADDLTVYVMHMSEFVFCQTQISVSHISAGENDFHLKFWGWSNWPPILLQTKFQVSSSPGTCFSKIQIWQKSAVNPILNVL